MVPPVLIKHDKVCGFYDCAASDMPELTIIAEYFGQVRTEEQILNSKNDSIMELLCT